MALLTATITALGLYGGPEAVNESYAGRGPAPTFPRSYTQDFTALGLNGNPAGPDGPFTGKSESSQDGKLVSDTYIARLTFSNFAGADVDVSDVYIPVLTLQGVAGLTRGVSDTYTPRLTFLNTGLLKSGSIPKAAADSYIPRLTFSASYRRQIAVTDTYVPVVSLSASLLTANTANVSDSYVPVLTLEKVSVNQTIAALSFARTDVYLPRLTMTAAVALGGNPRRIHYSTKPFGRIRYSLE